MKTTCLTSVLLLISIGLSAQTSLTHRNNAMITGDSNTLQEIQYAEPGRSGSNQVWDFSMIQYTGKNPVSTIQDAPVKKPEGVGNYNLSITENGNDFFMNSSESNLEEWGYINQEQKLILRYSDPVIKMKYPFSYGDQFTDHFIGVAWYSDTNTIDFFGDCTLAADAYGKLILPTQIIENVLRIKSVKKGLQINMCGTTEISMTRYSWYASGYRYPVFSVCATETRSNEGVSQITKSAYINNNQLIERSAILMADNAPTKKDEGNQPEKTGVTVTLSPNPFDRNLTFTYFLSEQLPVSIELYDMSGKHNGWLVKTQDQSAGLHTGELDALTYGLTPGAYFLRFTFDKQVVMRKVVKL